MNQLPPQLNANHAQPVINLLTEAMSPLDERRKPAEATLKQLEQRPGFVSLLLFLSQPSQEISAQVCQFAAIQLKNVVERQWRRGNIQQNEKESVKNGLLLRLNEPNPRVAEQLLVVISKIARNDVPNQWPTLFDSLTQQLTYPHSHFVLRTINKIFKVLSAKRIVTARQMYHELAEKMLPFFVDHWSKRQANLYQLLDQVGYDSNNYNVNNTNSSQVRNEASSCMYALKTICRLIAHGKPSLEPSKSIVAIFFQQVLPILQKNLTLVYKKAIVESQRRLSNNIPLYSIDVGDDEDDDLHSIERRLRQMVEVTLRTMNRLRSNNPIEFIPYMSTFLNITYSIVTNYYERVSSYGDMAKRYCMPTLLSCQFLSKCLTEREYENPKSQGGQIVNQFFMSSSSSSSNSICKNNDGGGGGNGSRSNPTTDTNLSSAPKVNILFRIVVTSLLNLTTSDLMKWEADPEEYVLSQESVSMNNNLRATAQDLFLALLEYDDHIMPQIFVQIMNDRSTHFNQRINSSNASMNELVELAKQMDGIWTAAGLDTSLLKQSLNYDEWFMNSLVPVITSALNQAQQNGGGNSNSSSSNSNINLSGSNSIVAVHTTPYQRIIQYRALWLIGCLTYELADNVYAPVYKSLMQLLAIQDVVVCVATIAALRSMVDNVGFGRDSFTSQDGCSKEFIRRLYYVLQQNTIQSFDTKASILDLVSNLIRTHEGPTGLPGTVDEIVGPLPTLWASSGDQNLLRTSILTILTEIVTAVGTSSNDAERVHLQVLPLVSYSTNKNNKESIYLAEEGYLLWKAILEHLTVYTTNIHNLFQNIIVTMKSQDYEHTTNCVTLIELYLCSGGTNFMNSYSNEIANAFALTINNIKTLPSLKLNKCITLMLQLYPNEIPSLLNPIFEIMLVSICTAATTTAPSSSTPINLRIIVSYLTIFARLLFQTPNAFRNLLTNACAKCHQTVDQLWSLLVNEWLDKFDEIGGGANGPWIKKSWVMALCVPLSSGDSIALSHFGEIIDLCVQALSDDTTSLATFVPSPNKGNCNNTTSSTFNAAMKSQTTRNHGNGVPRMSLEATTRQNQRSNDPVYCRPLKVTVQKAMQSCQSSIGQTFNQLVASSDSAVMGQLQSLLQ